MQQVFVTPNGLFMLLWNVAKRPAEGEDEEAFERAMVAEQVHWALIIQSRAPGSTVSSRPENHWLGACICAVLHLYLLLLSICDCISSTMLVCPVSVCLARLYIRGPMCWCLSVAFLLSTFLLCACDKRGFICAVE